MAAVSDGMGGLYRGELASAVVIRAFGEWFDAELGRELAKGDMKAIGADWLKLLMRLDLRLHDCGDRLNVRLGTTFSGILLAGGKYVMAHVGDSRVYHGGRARQMTKDHTFVAGEVRKGKMTASEAAGDRRRNLLTQCVGASGTFKPQIESGNAGKGAWLLCTDGFWHLVSGEEMSWALDLSAALRGASDMREELRELISLVKSRGETDNISAILVGVR